MESSKDIDKLLEGKRRFELEGAGEFIIEVPTADHIKQADFHYSKSYNDSLMAGLATSSELQDILKRRNIIGDSYDKKLEELRDEIGTAIVNMETENDRAKRKVLANKVAKLREELFAWNQRVQGPMSHCCESLAEDARVDFLTSCIVHKTDGSKLWSSFEEYQKEPNRALGFKARLEVMLFLQGIDPDFLERVPENMVLKQIEHEEEEEAEEASKVSEEPVEEVKAAKPRRSKKAPVEVEPAKE